MLLRLVHRLGAGQPLSSRQLASDARGGIATRLRRHGFFTGVDLGKLNVNRHGIRGWWACGYIEPAPGAEVVLVDTWGRAIVVIDEVSTGGFQLLTASGPLGDYRRYGDTDDGLARVYRNFVAHLNQRKLVTA